MVSRYLFLPAGQVFNTEGINVFDSQLKSLFVSPPAIAIVCNLFKNKFIDQQLPIKIVWHDNIALKSNPTVVLSGLPFSCCAATRNITGFRIRKIKIIRATKYDIII